jgi:hypothetical protein
MRVFASLRARRSPRAGKQTRSPTRLFVAELHQVDACGYSLRQKIGPARRWCETSVGRPGAHFSFTNQELRPERVEVARALPRQLERDQEQKLPTWLPRRRRSSSDGLAAYGPCGALGFTRMPESGVRRLRLLPCASVRVQNRRRANRVLLLLSSQRESLGDSTVELLGQACGWGSRRTGHHRPQWRRRVGDQSAAGSTPTAGVRCTSCPDYRISPEGKTHGNSRATSSLWNLR